jgi:glycosyltransferase involved in cell wall biosynthesis
MAPVRVFLLTPDLNFGGSKTFLTTLLNHLNAARLDPFLVAFRGGGPNQAKVATPERVIDLQASRVRWGFLPLIRAVRRFRPAVLLSSLDYLSLPLLGLKRWLPAGTSIVIRESNPPGASFPNDYDYPMVMTHLCRRYYPRSSRVICLSDSMASDVQACLRLPSEKLVCIYNPVDIDGIGKAADACPNPYSGHGPQLVSCGRLVDQKGFDLLLEAVALLRHSIPGIRLTLLGSGPLREKLEQQKRSLALQDSVTLLPFQQNPFPYIKHADLFVLSSRYEGLPNCVLEALALRRRAVAVPCPSGLEEIAATTSRLKITRERTAIDLAEGIGEALLNRENSAEQQLEPAFVERFGAHSVARQYEALFETAAAV